MKNYRVPSKEVVHKRILILCEGESEQKYLLNYCTLRENKDRLRYIQIRIFKPDRNSPLGLVNEAKKFITEAKRDKFPYEKVWIVFDKDSHANIPSAFEESERFNPKINIAFTARCFEIWIFLHFEKVNKPFNCCDDVIRKLKETYCPAYEKMHLQNEIYQTLDKAIENAQWLSGRNQNAMERGTRLHELDCCTSMHLLMQFLKGL